MKQHKKPPSGDEKRSIVLCSKCGFPNRVTDVSCMYCQLPIGQAYKPTLKEKISLYFKQRQWRKKGQQKKSTSLQDTQKHWSLSKRIVMLTIGIVLTLAGATLFVLGTMNHSFKTWLISILFLLYGVCTISLFKKAKRL